MAEAGDFATVHLDLEAARAQQAESCPSPEANSKTEIMNIRRVGIDVETRGRLTATLIITRVRPGSADIAGDVATIRPNLPPAHDREVDLLLRGELDNCNVTRIKQSNIGSEGPRIYVCGTYNSFSKEESERVAMLLGFPSVGNIAFDQLRAKIEVETATLIITRIQPGSAKKDVRVDGRLSVTSSKLAGLLLLAFVLSLSAYDGPTE
ncbi:hypothetical protein V8E36_003651 [Tilletia maclaganii]